MVTFNSNLINFERNQKNKKIKKVIPKNSKNPKIQNNPKNSTKKILAKKIYIFRFQGGTLSLTHERTQILVSNLGSLDGIPSRI